VAAYAILIPGSTDTTDAVYLASCHRDDGTSESNYLALDSQSDYFGSVKVYAEDREYGGDQYLFSASLHSPATTSSTAYYLYIVPSALDDVYLPSGYDVTNLTTALETLDSENSAGTLTWTELYAFIQMMKDTGYPWCGSIDQTSYSDTGSPLKIIHSDIF
jgi:hypothetical protein